MKAEDFIELIEQNRFDKISKNGMTLIAERFRELQSKQLTLTDVGLHSELLLCGVCDVETWHDTSNKKELNCLKCGNVAKE